ncbi:MAG: PSD1 and planctomycete cytochrome C domain-containing protein [Opitutales bacterium]
MPPKASLFLGVFLAAACAAEPISFSRQIRPILSENCIACHGPDEKARKGKLRLDDEQDAKRDRKGDFVILPGKPEQSELIRRIESTDPDEVMPPPKQHKTIPPAQLALLREWIRQGAPWGRHWSYEPVVRPSVPKNGEANPVDAFLADRQKKEGLTWSAEAPKSVLIRRVALDVTGLPPTPAEVAQLADAPQADVVAHFLAKPAYGEHWARQWLDLARYADSAGYPSDPGRTIWAYRDWVIKALNRNQPFDQFVIDQLAGDLLPDPTEDQIIATAFHRNTMTQNEGGTSDEEFRNAAVIDRVNTTYAVFMGTTMACAQCHTHKYDPITITEYFRSYAFLNQSADSDKRDEAPLYEIYPPGMKAQRDQWMKESAAAEAAFKKPSPAWLDGFEAWLAKNPKPGDKALKAALDAPKDKRTKAQDNLLRQHYVRNVSPASKAERAKADLLKKQIADSAPVTVPVMQDLVGEKRRKTFVQLRGNWQALGDQVDEGVPTHLARWDETYPKNRLGLARWIVSPDNPLTARVTMNRLWESVFGVGIVRTSEEFGSQGDLPVHPELLDWLASEFVASGWDTKKMLSLLLNSRAYRQSSASDAKRNERDPDNRFVARGPRFRPSGEMLRDQALAVSGLLSAKMYGKPVRPMRPNMGLSIAFGGSGDWMASTGEDRHRRSLYTETRRSTPYPSFATFDAPNRETCVIRRDRSNTPLQAFVTLNDPVFVETSQALARRLLKEGGVTEESRLKLAYALCLSREPDAGELKTLKALLAKSLAEYRADVGLAAKMATEPLGPADKGADLPTLAAWTAVSSVIMNLDEFLMRR